MEHNNIYNGNRTAEAMPMTCGMSDELLQSDLLSRISVLSLNDKQSLQKKRIYRTYLIEQ